MATGNMKQFPTSDPSQSIIVATTRPETMFGDTGVAVHPNDKRYEHLIGQTVTVPYTNRNIPIVADRHVDQDFGSGAVKATPAHDPNDFDIGNRHNLDRILIMDESAIMNKNAPTKYQGMDRYTCRKQLVADLDSDGYLDRIDDHVHNVGTNTRSGEVIEPYLSNQWFIDMKALAQTSIDAVKNKDVTFVPSRWEKLYFEWMDNIRDWHITPNLVGASNPCLYKKDDPNDFIVSETPPEPADEYVQDSDTGYLVFIGFMAIFNHGLAQRYGRIGQLLPHIAFGYRIRYLNILGVSRMITMGLFEMDHILFSHVYIHGLVRDIHGKKMSKSIGNVINPLDIIDEHGADALRFGLASLCTKGGQDIKLSPEKIQASRNFTNKLWNFARFVDMSLIEVDQTIDPTKPPTSTTDIDCWIMDRLHLAIDQITHHINDYNFAAAADELWEFTWNQCCDWYVEGMKSHKQDSIHVLSYVCFTTLILLHPYMPFVTEAIWKRLSSHPNINEDHIMDTIQHAQWPTANAPINQDRLNQFDASFNVIREIRHLIKAANLSTKDPPSVHLSHPRHDHSPTVNCQPTVYLQTNKNHTLSYS